MKFFQNHWSLLVDRQARCLVVTLYNLSPGKGVIIGRRSGSGIKIAS
jgi:hypothetical protein